MRPCARGDRLLAGLAPALRACSLRSSAAAPPATVADTVLLQRRLCTTGAARSTCRATTPATARSTNPANPDPALRGSCHQVTDSARSSAALASAGAVARDAGHHHMCCARAGMGRAPLRSAHSLAVAAEEVASAEQQPVSDGPKRPAMDATPRMGLALVDKSLEPRPHAPLVAGTHDSTPATEPDRPSPSGKNGGRSTKRRKSKAQEGKHHSGTAQSDQQQAAPGIEQQRQIGPLGPRRKELLARKERAARQATEEETAVAHRGDASQPGSQQPRVFQYRARRVKYDMWKCMSCDYSNEMVRTQCASCGGHRPRMGDWFCRSCNGLNFVWQTRCRSCDIDRTMDCATVGASRGDWLCTKCLGYNKYFRTDCIKCGHSQKGSRVGDWTCTSCQEVNFASRSSCHFCNAEKPHEPEPMWTCGTCKTKNSMALSMCLQCQAPVSGIALAFAQKWACPGCHFLNKNGRRVCIRCATPHPLVKR